jgi:hypothetical protein
MWNSPIQIAKVVEKLCFGGPCFYLIDNTVVDSTIMTTSFFTKVVPNICQQLPASWACLALGKAVNLIKRSCMFIPTRFCSRVKSHPTPLPGREQTRARYTQLTQREFVKVYSFEPIIATPSRLCEQPFVQVPVPCTACSWSLLFADRLKTYDELMPIWPWLCIILWPHTLFTGVHQSITNGDKYSCYQINWTWNI